MSRRGLAVLALVTIAAIGVWWWRATRTADTPPARGSSAAESDTPGSPARDVPGSGGSAATTWDGAPIAATLHDREARERLRQRILVAWASQGDPEVAAAAKAGRFVPAPTGPEGGAMDPKYIQEVVRGEFMPMAKKCYEELLTRRKKAKGRMEMSFTIVADDKLGGIVEDVEADHGDSGIADERMTTCMRESMSTLAFRPPARGGVVTVVYPMEFSDDDDDD